MQGGVKMMTNSLVVSISMFLFLMLPGYALAGDYQLPDTGIDKCYDNHSEITCPSPGEPFYGQDAQYDGPPLSYQDNGDGTVSDLNTGLMWQQSDDGTTRTWQGACDYCEALALPLGGYSDWRLPNRRELMSIVDYSRFKPPIDTEYFPDCRWSYYWSGSTYVANSPFAWYVVFLYGSVYHYGKAHHGYVRCVRGGPTPAPSFHDNENGTVSDSETGLMWQQGDGQNKNDSGRTWEEALDYCESLNLAGYSDWRLPNVRNLESIVDWNRYNPAIDTKFFSDCLSSFYWSSSTNTYYSFYAWSVGFGYGYVDDGNGTYGNYVRCVRGGPSPTVITMAISSITATTASSGGNVTSDGGASVTAKGVCWSTSTNPTTSDSHTSDGTGTGSFTSSITGLSAGTTYHVRAYATNSAGTGYGSDVTFKTSYASTLYVSLSGDCGDKTPCYDSIQEAIDAASTGSLISIAQGTYDESIVLNEPKALTLKGGWDSTFTTQTSDTMVSSITISNGTVAVDKLVIQ